MKKIIIYSDGSARSNPGPGGYGTITMEVDDDFEISNIKEYSKGFKETTNNRMELLGAIIGLESIEQSSEIILYSDSKYLTQAINYDWITKWIAKGWKTASGKPVKNIDLWMRLLKIIEYHQSVEFEWVKGHSDNIYNNKCDSLANKAADIFTNNNMEEDEGYISNNDESILDVTTSLNLVVDIIDVFETFLESKGINIENDEKDESSSTIYGTDYYSLEDDIKKVLSSYHIIQPGDED